MAKYQGKGKSSKRGRRGLTLGMSIPGVDVVGAGIGGSSYGASADLPGEKFADLGNEHIQAASDPHVAYNSEPPTSGPHLPNIAPWVIPTRPIPNELQV